tara:strand:+ start:3651 stop:4592 length:942 start_codon:yes stop_codon:yes gene_type:complete
MKYYSKENYQRYTKLLVKTKENIRKLTKNLEIESLSPKFLEEIVIPLSTFFNSLPNREKPYFVCITGGQGSGKTTLSDFVQLVIKKGFYRSTVGFSIDDIYKTKEEREELSNSIHPLCKTRGVPGTHNIQLGLDTIDSLCNAGNSTLTPIPAFSKLLDQPLPRKDWKCYEGRPDFIFFDAWCGGARPISEKKWKPPMNNLEKEEDPHGVWSKWSNQELAGDYQDLFDLFDLLLMIKVPSMGHVYESRWLQEQTLAKRSKNPESKKRIMTKKQVYRFVMHYERITRYIMKEIPFIADIVLERDEKFNFSIIKTP